MMLVAVVVAVWWNTMSAVGRMLAVVVRVGNRATAMLKAAVADRPDAVVVVAHEAPKWKVVVVVAAAGGAEFVHTMGAARLEKQGEEEAVAEDSGEQSLLLDQVQNCSKTCLRNAFSSRSVTIPYQDSFDLPESTRSSRERTPRALALVQPRDPCLQEESVSLAGLDVAAVVEAVAVAAGERHRKQDNQQHKQLRS